jgi:hypothetical protein
MGQILKGPPVAAPSVPGIQALPVVANGLEQIDVVDELQLAIPIGKEVEVDRAFSKVRAIHCLATANLDVDLLQLRLALKFPAGDYEAAATRVLDELTDIPQECRLLA